MALGDVIEDALRRSKVQTQQHFPALHRPITAANLYTEGYAKKKRPRKAGVKLLRQVSYRQETYRAVTPL